MFENPKSERIDRKKIGYNLLLEVKIDARYKKKIKNDPSIEDRLYEEGKIIKPSIPHYTDDALVYRSILFYGINKSKPGEFFKSRQITKEWLLDDCIIFYKKYLPPKNKTSKKTIAENENDKVVSHLEKLCYLDLLESKMITAKNGAQTYEYRFTNLGLLIASLLHFNEIEAENRRNYPDKIDRIYEQLRIYFSSLDYTHAKFCNIFFRRCYEINRDYFKDVIIFELLKILNNANDEKRYLNNEFRNFQVFYNSKSLLGIFIGSLVELKEINVRDYQKVMYRIKKTIEYYHEIKCKYLEGFEEEQFALKGIVDHIALEGYCNNCKKYTSVTFKTMKYLIDLVMKPTNNIRASCPNPACKDNGGLNFEIWNK